MKKNRNFLATRFFWPFVVLAVVGVGAVLSNAVVVEKNTVGSPATPGNLSAPTRTPVYHNTGNHSPGTALRLQEGISDVVSKVRPSVVAVTGPMAGPAPQEGGLTYVDPYRGNSGLVGSGFIIDHRGYVLTTFRTVGKAARVKVTLFGANRTEYVADVLGVDAKTDLALLKIRSNDIFQAIVLGNSDLVEIGDIVFAIGSPFGFSRSVTMGIVSSNRRTLNIDGVQYPDTIQTDATINEGNDGGPLVNVRGEVVGVNMAYYRPHNRFSGIGFAVPINNVLEFIKGF